MVKTKGLK